MSEDIDSRTDIGRETKAIIKAIRGERHERPRNTQNIGGWTFEPVGKKYWRITRTARYITMTAAEDTTELAIPFPHRWLKITFLHTNNLEAPIVNDELTIQLFRAQVRITPQNFAEYLYYMEYAMDSHITKLFEDYFVYEPTTYHLIIYDAIAGYLVFPVFYIEQLGE